MSRIRLVWLVVTLLGAAAGFASDVTCKACSDFMTCRSAVHMEDGYVNCAGSMTDACGKGEAYYIPIFAPYHVIQGRMCEYWKDTYSEDDEFMKPCFVNQGPYYREHCHTDSTFTCSTYNPPPGGDGSSPIMLNLGAAWDISDVADGVSFDLDGDGVREIRSWPRGAVGIITQERDGKPTTTSGQDLYGDWTPVKGEVTNGFVWMLAEDANGDRFFDARDPRFLTAKVWFDSNPRDGVEQAHEVRPLSSLVEWISLDYHWTGRRDKNGNEFRYQAAVKYLDGKIDQAYDVWLQTAVAGGAQ